MQSPRLRFVKRSFATRSLLFLLALTAMAFSAVAQKSPSFRILAPEAAAFQLEQCANGGRAIPQVQNPCNVDADWVNGNVNASKAHFREGDSIPYRLLISGLTPGVSTYVTFGWDTTKGGKHAIDYITSYDRTENASNPGGPSQALPCAGLDPLLCPLNNIAGDDQFQIPADPNYSGAVPAPNSPQDTTGEFIKIWGGDITGLERPAACGNDTNPTPNANPYILCGLYSGDSSTGLTVRFTPTGSQVMMAWGGHIARRLDWGLLNGATGISGSPFHMSMITGGSQELQLAAGSVLFAGAVQVVKVVNTIVPVGGTSATFQFGFTSSANSGLNSFFLVDDDGGPGVDNVAAAVTNFFVAGDPTNEITVTENNYANAPHPFVLTDLRCEDMDGGLGFVADSIPQPGMATAAEVAARKVTVRVQEGEVVRCTFINTESLSPSAAAATISGRAVDSFGRGISGARITVMDAQTGELSSAITNSFGYYTVVGTQVETFYVMTISHRRFTFADDTRSFTLHDNLAGVDFVANP